MWHGFIWAQRQAPLCTTHWVWTKHRLLIMLSGIALRQSAVLLRSFPAMQMFQCPWSLQWWRVRGLSCHQGCRMFSQLYFYQALFCISTTEEGLLFSDSQLDQRPRNLIWTGWKISISADENENVIHYSISISSSYLTTVTYSIQYTNGTVWQPQYFSVLFIYCVWVWFNTTTGSFMCQDLLNCYYCEKQWSPYWDEPVLVNNANKGF